MATLQLHLPDDLKDRLQARAAQSGYATVEQFAQAILQASAAEEELLDEDLDALLVGRLNDARPGVEFTPTFREQFRQQVNQRRQSRRG